MGQQLETADQIAALAFLYDRIDYERQSPPVERGEFRLDRMRQLNERLGNPAATLPCIHVAGTKGKGSTAAMIASMLKADGRRVGCSPRRICTRSASACGWMAIRCPTRVFPARSIASGRTYRLWRREATKARRRRSRR